MLLRNIKQYRYAIFSCIFWPFHRTVCLTIIPIFLPNIVDKKTVAVILATV